MLKRNRLFIIFQLMLLPFLGLTQKEFIAGKIDTLQKINLEKDIVLYQVIEKGRHGIIHQNGKMLLPTKYVSLDFLRNKYCIANDGNKNLLIDLKTGNIAIKKFEAFANKDIYKEDITIIKKGKYGVFSTKEGKLIVPFKFDYVQEIRAWPNIKILHKRGSFYLFYLNDQKIVDQKYEKIDIPRKSGKYLIALKGDHIYVHDRYSSKLLAKLKGKNYIENFRYVAVKQKNNKWKVWSTSPVSDTVNPKQVRLSPEIDSFYYDIQEGGTFFIKEDKFYGVYDLEKRKTIIPMCYDSLSKIGFYREFDYYKAFGPNNKVGIINQKGDTLLPFKFDDAYISINTKVDTVLYWGKKGNYFSPVRDGKLELKYQYESIDSKFVRTSDPVSVRKNNKQGVYSLRHNKEIIACEYDTIIFTFPGFVGKKDSLFWLINGEGNVLNSHPFKAISRIKLDFIKVQSLDNKIGIYNPKKETFILQPEYDEAEWIVGSFNPWMFRKGDNFGIIDFWKGKVIVPPQYDELIVKNGVDYIQSKRCTRVRKGHLWGWIDIDSGELVIPCKFDDVRPFEEGKAKVKVKYGWIEIDEFGKRVE